MSVVKMFYNELKELGRVCDAFVINHLLTVPGVTYRNESGFSSSGEVYYNKYYSNEQVRLAKLVRNEYYNGKDNEIWEELPESGKKFWLDYSIAAKKAIDREQFRDGWSNK